MSVKKYLGGIMSGKRSRDRGLNFEREIANVLRPLFPNAKRHLESQSQEAKGYDLDNTEPFLIQCKRNKKYCSISKLTEPQCKEGEIPMLITKGDRTQPVVCMYLDDFIKHTQKCKEEK